MSRSKTRVPCPGRAPERILAAWVTRIRAAASRTYAREDLIGDCLRRALPGARKASKQDQQGIVELENAAIQMKPRGVRFPLRKPVCEIER